MRRGIIMALLLCLAAPAAAHEMRPAYLALHEETAGKFHVLWKTPMRGDLRLALAPEFSGATEILTPMTVRARGGAAVQTWMLRAVEPLRGQSIRIRGLESTMTDALVRMEFVDGTTWTQRLTPGRPAAMIPVRQSWISVAGVYLKFGVEHILFGFDHLLFVLALLIITKGTWPLVKTVTAFTVAHSITLALATLGFVHVPQPPVEAVIALSIAFVAAEILHGLQGREGIAARAPWIVALTFGLLHGLGFAGALSEIGLPEGRIPLALLFFNLGVEVGQLLFIGGVLMLVAAARNVTPATPYWARLVPPYAIGTMAMFWVFQRIAAF
jgi:HupE / UreJ protein